MNESVALVDALSFRKETDTKVSGNGISRPTEELVIGMVGAVGGGVSYTSSILKKILEEEYDYSVEILKASEIIRENAEKAGVITPAKSGVKRIIDLQTVGTSLREKFKKDYIAAKAIEKIAIKRKEMGGYDETTQVSQPKRRRKATIIDSLKHPKESFLLREVYGGVYWQFTVFAPEKIRETRLRKDGVDKDELAGIFTRDESDVEKHGQQVSKTAYLSDFFIRNDGENDEELKRSVGRFLGIVFNITVHTPSSDEAGMLAAVSAASKSACLSRQVGAAIYSRDGELVSVGWNDVPRAGGGLYSVDQGTDDHRCYKWGGKICHNDSKKEDLYERVFERLRERKLLAKDVSKEELRSALIETPVKHLIEYSRSIHAEMEAIVSASRTGKSGMVGGTIYTTTFPCHNCARHIVAAGISKVFYVEPYAKSLAMELHSDSIGLTEGSGNKVTFLQYEGVGPESIPKLFHHGIERKREGKVCEVDKKSAVPVLPPPMDGFATHEKRIITELAGLESAEVDAEVGSQNEEQ